MLKNLLKSSVSVVVVLGILSTLNPSQAGNSNGSISRLPEDEKTRSLKSSKKKIKIKNKEPEGVEIIDLSLGYNLLREDENILKLMLMQRGIDFDTLMSTRLVSKTWNSLILSSIENLEKALRDPHYKIEILKDYIRHPSTLVFAHKILGPEFPYQLAYFPADSQVVHTIPKNIQKFVAFIHSSPHLHTSLCEVYTQLNPLDFKVVGLASHIIKNSVGLSNNLIEFSNKTVFKFDEFTDLIKDPANHENLKQHLITLKLLALSGDKMSEVQLDEFAKSILLP